MDVLFEFKPKAKKDLIDQHLNVGNAREVPLKNDGLTVQTEAMINVFVKSVRENGETLLLPIRDEQA